MNSSLAKIWIPVILIVLFAGGFLAWQYFKTPKEEAKDETADWRVYTNTFTNYQVKYPNYWQVVDKRGDGYLVEFSDPSREDKNKFTFYSGLTTARGLVCWKKIEEETILVAERDAIKYILIPSEDKVVVCDLPETAKLILIEFAKDSIQYSLEFYIFDNNLELADKALSTFKLLGVADETADWQTYRNEEYGFELKYPTGFNIKELPQNTIGDLGILPWLIAVEFTDKKIGQPSANIFIRDFNRVSEVWCRDVGGEFNGSIEIMSQERLKCLRPEFGASTLSEYSVLIGKIDNIFFDFDCGDLAEAQLCDQMLSTFRFLE